MKLWGGRFTKEENQLVHNFNESISFDQKFYRQDIEGSIAHVTMLARQGILSEEDKDAIIKHHMVIGSDLPMPLSSSTRCAPSTMMNTPAARKRHPFELMWLITCKRPPLSPSSVSRERENST